MDSRASKGSRMVQMELPNKLADRLDEIADEEGLKRHGVVRRALALYEAQRAALRAGGTLVLRMPDGSETEFGRPQ